MYFNVFDRFTALFGLSKVVCRVSTIVAFGLITFGLFSPTYAECPGESTAEQAGCAALAFKKADQQLNEVYKKVIAQQDATGKALLIKSENAWIKFRDSHCEFVADLYRGGSRRPTQYTNCRIEMTRVQTMFLRERLPEQPGPQEEPVNDD